MLRRLIRLAAAGAVTLALLIFVAAVVADRFLSKEVQFISPKPAAAVALDREMWEQGQPVAELYGTPLGSPVKVVLADGDRLVAPREQPGFLLMKVDKQRGENPLQLKTVWFVAVRLIAALGVAFALLLALSVWITRRQRKKTPESDTSPEAA